MKPFNARPNRLVATLFCAKTLFTFCLFLLPFAAFAEQGLDDWINEKFMPIAKWWEYMILYPLQLGEVGLPIVLIILLGGATFFTIYFRFVNLRGFLLALKIVSGKYDDLEKDGNKENGEINHFQALTTAVSGTVGLGNISMVAVAISLGGPGATFWMILAGFLGMTSKFVECTLGVKYRKIDANGKVYGGPMYYLSEGLALKGRAKLGKFLAFLFALLCVGASLGGGNAFQSNQAAAQLISQFDINGAASGTYLGLMQAFLVGIVIIGGVKRIAKVTEKIVPIMALIYVLAALFILITYRAHLGEAIGLIISEAFSPQATIVGGAVGVMIQGFRRAAFSNEAGAGSAAIAHSAVKTKFPASEGLVSLLEPFIDTVVICTITALVLVLFNLNGAFTYGLVSNNQVTIIETGELIGGVNLTSLAFDTAIPGFSYVLAIAVTLFAFSTMLSWSYYGLQAWTYLFGRSRWIDLSYKLLFLTFTVLGAAITMDAVIKFSDAMILALVFPNMLGLFFLFPQVKEEFKKFKMVVKREKQNS